ncbi:MAG: GNAT family N-acetyltransferase [Polyangiaceae bacterium]
MVAPALSIRVDDLTEEATRALVARHLQGMHESSPPESVHALGIDELRAPDVVLWSGWAGPELAVIGALKALDATSGEIKSMRAADAFRGRGAGKAMLDHILAEARARRYSTLWLETGSTPDFEPAIRLYERAGFVRCGPFGDYTLDPFSIFMRLDLNQRARS